VIEYKLVPLGGVNSVLKKSWAPLFDSSGRPCTTPQGGMTVGSPLMYIWLIKSVSRV